MSNNQTSNYQTKDLAEAAMLLTMRRTLIDMRRDGNTCWFIFTDKKRCEELSRQFFFDTLLVNARDYYDSMSRLKNRIFAEG